MKMSALQTALATLPPGKEHQWSLKKGLSGLFSRSEGFVGREHFVPIGIRTTERPSRSLASILTVQLAPHAWLLKPCVPVGCH